MPLAWRISFAERSRSQRWWPGESQGPKERIPRWEYEVGGDAPQVLGGNFGSRLGIEPNSIIFRKFNPVSRWRVGSPSAPIRSTDRALLHLEAGATSLSRHRDRSSWPVPDLLYFLLRAALCGVTAVVAAAGLRHSSHCRRTGHPWVLPTIGSCLLGAASVLSAYDAIDNVVLRPDAPIPLANWLWYFLFDLVMPIWAALAIRARQERNRALEELSNLSVTDQLTGTLNRRAFIYERHIDI
jgi:hypothetical protein